MSFKSANILNRFLHHFNGVAFILTTIIIAIILRLFCFQIFKIQSSSMAPTLLQGDIVLVSKIGCGARFFKMKGNQENGKKLIRIKGLSKFGKLDIIVFNKPIYPSYINRNFFGEIVVKRCYGLPGETTKINNMVVKRFYNDLNNESEIDVPYYQEYASVYIPVKGVSIQLNKENIISYKNILAYELAISGNGDSLLDFENKEVLQHTFRHDYYYMIGDNFYHSQDSRSWGLVPDDCIIGKALFIICSFDSHQSSLNKFRWSRFFKAL